MDRQKPGVTKSQPGFIDFVVRPLFETWVACFPESRVLLDRINANYEYWQVRPSTWLPAVAARLRVLRPVPHARQLGGLKGLVPCARSTTSRCMPAILVCCAGS